MTPRLVPPTPFDQQNSFSSDSTTTTITSPTPSTTSSSNTSSNSNTAPNSPSGPQQQPQQVPIVTNQQQNSSASPSQMAKIEKRVKWPSTNGSNLTARNSSNRHSTELQSAQMGDSKTQEKRFSLKLNSGHESLTMESNSTKSIASKTKNEHNLSTSGQRHQMSSLVSNAYVALHPYKPQKTDELELKKGGKNLLNCNWIELNNLLSRFEQQFTT